MSPPSEIAPVERHNNKPAKVAAFYIIFVSKP